MSYSVQAQVNELKAWVGFREGAGNIQPFTAWQFNGGLSNLAWCGSFANYCAVKAGGFQWPSYCQEGVRGDAYVPFSKEHAIQMGIWKPNSSAAQVGWQVIYDWSGSGGDHIETVVADGPGYTLNIGGNTGDMVAYRTRPKDSHCLGFIALNMAGQGGSQIVVPPTVIGQGEDVKLTDIVDGVTDGTGALIVQADGGVFARHGASFHGSVPGLGIKLIPGKSHVVAILKTVTNKGYWLLGYDGAVFSFGDAAYHGNFQKKINALKIPVRLVRSANNSYAAILADGTTVPPS